MANLQHLIKPRWQHKTTVNDVAKMYYSQLSRSDIQRLYQKYQLDFELFNYSIADYVKYAKDYEVNEIK